MIVSIHVAIGALAGLVAGSPRRAVGVGAATHLAGDWIPHNDLPSLAFEVRSGVAEVLALASCEALWTRLLVVGTILAGLLAPGPGPTGLAAVASRPGMNRHDPLDAVGVGPASGCSTVSSAVTPSATTPTPRPVDNSSRATPRSYGRSRSARAASRGSGIAALALDERAARQRHVEPRR